MSGSGDLENQERATPSDKRMANESTTKAKETQHGESLDLHVEAAADKATGIDNEALPIMIENDMHHEVSSKFIEEAPSSKLPDQKTSSPETPEEYKLEHPPATTSTSSALNKASEGHKNLKKDSENFQFTLFPNLPIEVRLKIWQCTFVKRHIDLDFALAYRFTMRGEGTYKPVDRYIPVTLAVNHKSRHETLKHYSFIFFSEELEVSQWPDFDIHHIGPGWIHPSLDTIVFSEPPAVLRKEAYDSWFDHIASRIYMGDFRELEVRLVLWDEDMEAQTEPYYPSLEFCRLFEHIMRFRGPRTVVLRGHGVAGPTDEQLEIIRKLAVEYLEREKCGIDGCVVSVVKVGQYTDVESGEKTLVEDDFSGGGWHSVEMGLLLSTELQE
ncbi:hypothetical protein NA56DRAFT_691921 [Hyaloscypha hepaticicola]|uniref:2EXR domain-containing protein n=1 Tax=Hyaloscypha hepaticicola TaxID=2082293 RepID=A0A2J6PTM1_9HELO|nr:hypothetical protein NA56DRAFT_691921 [Hyaloscypha hepaticicola]